MLIGSGRCEGLLLDSALSPTMRGSEEAVTRTLEVGDEIVSAVAWLPIDANVHRDVAIVGQRGSARWDEDLHACGKDGLHALPRRGVQEKAFSSKEPTEELQDCNKNLLCFEAGA